MPRTSSGSEYLNVPEGQHRTEYDPTTRDQLVAEAAAILLGLGYAAQHVVLIGGLVPGLLVPALDPDVEPHIGTADIDLCLSVALVEGDTELYERIEIVLRRLGFEQADTSFRWHRTHALPLVVEFFCPAGSDRPPGQAFRPRQQESATAKHNMGGKLSALAIEAGHILTQDVETVAREVDLPERKGQTTVTLRVTGPLAFLVAKSQALVGPTARDKPKDAYDIVWLVESWPGGPVAAAAAFAARPQFSDPGVATALEVIRGAFADTKQIGARSYARFMDDDARRQAQFERRAVGAVAEFLTALPPPA